MKVERRGKGAMDGMLGEVGGMLERTGGVGRKRKGRKPPRMVAFSGAADYPGRVE